MKKYVLFIILALVINLFAEIFTRNDAINYYKQLSEKYGYISFVERDSKYYAIGLSNEKITNNDLEPLVFFPEVKVVFLRNSKITDDGLKYLGELNNLERLILEKTKITDSGLIHLKNLKSLNELDLFYTKVTDKGIQELASVKSLRLLMLHGTKVTQKGIDELKKKLPNCEITLATKDELQ